MTDLIINGFVASVRVLRAYWSVTISKTFERRFPGLMICVLIAGLRKYGFVEVI